jgi:hypothetical protein
MDPWVGIEVVKGVVTEGSVFWDITSCLLLASYLFLAWLTLQPWRWWRNISIKMCDFEPTTQNYVPQSRTLYALMSVQKSTCRLQGSKVQTRFSHTQKKKQTPWLMSASELCRPSDRRLSAKLVPNLADRGCRVVSATNPDGPQLVINMQIISSQDSCRHAMHYHYARI